MPYCGTAPIAAEVWARWNFDPWLVAALSLFVLWGLARVRRDVRRLRAFGAAQLLLFVAFISPLCALASALFSARVAHHLLLVAGAAPLLAIAFAHRNAFAEDSRAVSLMTLTAIHAIVLWVWHTPAPYALALSNDAVYWLMQLTLLISAWLLWRAVLAPQTSPGPALLALLATVMQMGMLGAVLVFAPRALFAPHFGTTASFGLSELQDQQLAGLLMWVPAMAPYLAVSLVLCGSFLRAHAVTATR